MTATLPARRHAIEVRPDIVPGPVHPVGGSRRIALVHDYLAQYGGAERVLEVLHDLYPEAPVFTSLVDQAALPSSFSDWDLRESFLARLPAASRLHRALIPLYPRAFRRLAEELQSFDVVVADSSAWAHHAGIHPDATLVCYCHSPARFLYGDRDYLTPAKIPPVVGQAAAALFVMLRRADRRAAARVDRFVANSRNVAARIRRTYGRDVAVVYPPVDVDRFAGPEFEPEPWYLVVSRLVPHKRIDLAVMACTRYGLPLKVIGDGRAMDDLRRQAGPTVEFLGQVDDAAVISHMQRCRAMLLPGAEDFGMTAIEAQAAGRPVIAFGAGGALESVIPEETGLFFGTQTAEAVTAAIERFEARRWESRRCRANAARFGRDRFLGEMAAEVDAAVAAKRASRGGVGKG